MLQLVQLASQGFQGYAKPAQATVKLVAVQPIIALHVKTILILLIADVIQHVPFLCT